MNIIIALFTVILFFVSIFLILVVLMQKSKSDGSMGAALGGGAAEATFGADTSNVLSRATIKAAILFFVLSLVLYLANIYTADHSRKSGGAAGKLPTALTTQPEAAEQAPAANTTATPPAAAEQQPAPAPAP